MVQQSGKPQDVYDEPTNLFVAKFLGTPPINVFSGKIQRGRLLIGEDDVTAVPNVPDQEVTVGIRPEGFIPDENGPLRCQPVNVEVMGRDVSIVSTHSASQNPFVRSIVDADNRIDENAKAVRFTLKPHKLFIFSKETEERIV